MPRLKWNAVGERLFEAGVDRGVLYVDGADGVPWNGLISVSESPSGGEVTPYYIDGLKYLDHVSAEEFEATIEAYTYPEEFNVCEGTTLVRHGLFGTQQSKKSFGLSYRTKIGNDVKSVDFGYKIHILYNATTLPTDRDNKTFSNEIEPFNFSWKISTRPPIFAGLKPTAHFIVDTRYTPANLVSYLQDILYGAPNQTPRLPTVLELLFIFEEYESLFKDAGTLVETYFETIDAGHIPEEQFETIDPGGP